MRPEGHGGRWGGSIELNRQEQGPRKFGRWDERRSGKVTRFGEGASAEGLGGRPPART